MLPFAFFRHDHSEFNRILKLYDMQSIAAKLFSKVSYFLKKYDFAKYLF